LYMTTDTFTTSDIRSNPVTVGAPKLDGTLIEPSSAALAEPVDRKYSHGLPLETVAFRSVSHVDQSVVSHTGTEKTVLMQTETQFAMPQMLAGGEGDPHVSERQMEIPLLSATPEVDTADIESSAGLTKVSSLSAIYGHSEATISDLAFGDAVFPEVKMTPNQLKASQPQIPISVSNQGEAVAQPLQPQTLSQPEALIEAEFVLAQTKHQDEPAARPTSAQTTAPITPPINPVVSKAEALDTAQSANIAAVVDHEAAEVVSIDTSSADLPTDATDMAGQSYSVPSATERSAALYSGMTENATFQAIPDGGSRLQEFEITPLYGGADSLSAPLGQLFQAEPLPQTSRVELPAHIAAQIADAARQLPDGPIEISLSPEELGKVKLTFQVSENGAMNVVVATERAETLELMRRNVDSLLAEFSDLGYEGSSFQFQQDGQNTSGDQSEQSGSGGASGSISSTDSIQSPQSDTDPLSPVRLHLDGTAGMDLRL
ncbi:flagellar hook-length control protein FliK, partial [Pacificibacter marinus]|uniref:flagellar hook-length control protein FliK n=2 Tax=Pacificibacter TaxID=1042323 RepID=UPI001C09D532